MAGDWIKMRGNLWDDPRVARLCDLTDSPEAMIVGGLYWLWATADQHSEDGVMPGLTLRSIDRKTGIQGFGQALCDIGWLEDHPEGVRIVRFDEHNGASAKRRSLDAQRKANLRNVSASQADMTPTEGGQNAPDCGARERVREEIGEEPPNPLAGGESPAKPKRERKPRTSLQTFVDRCKTNGERLISEYGPLLEYVQATGLPMEFVQLCWDEFKGEFMPGGSKASRLQADWRGHFLNFVRKGYYRLWYAKPDGTFELSTAGMQARSFHAERAAA